MNPKHETSLGNPPDGYLAGSEKDLNGVLLVLLIGRVMLSRGVGHTSTPEL